MTSAATQSAALSSGPIPGTTPAIEAAIPSAPLVSASGLNCAVIAAAACSPSSPPIAGSSAFSWRNRSSRMVLRSEKNASTSPAASASASIWLTTAVHCVAVKPELPTGGVHEVTRGGLPVAVSQPAMPGRRLTTFVTSPGSGAFSLAHRSRSVPEEIRPGVASLLSAT